MDAASIREIRSYDDLVAALGARIVGLNVSYETIDTVAGLTTRHTSRLFGPNPSKRLGLMSLSAILGALGCKLVLVEDPEQLARVQSRLVAHKGDGPPSHWRRRARKHDNHATDSQSAAGAI